MIFLLLRNIHALERRICELEEAVRFQTTVELEPRAQFVGIDQSKDVPVMSLADAQRLGHARVDCKKNLAQENVAHLDQILNWQLIKECWMLEEKTFSRRGYQTGTN